MLYTSLTVEMLFMLTVLMQTQILSKAFILLLQSLYFVGHHMEIC